MIYDVFGLFFMFCKFFFVSLQSNINLLWQKNILRIWMKRVEWRLNHQLNLIFIVFFTDKEMSMKMFERLSLFSLLLILTISCGKDFNNHDTDADKVSGTYNVSVVEHVNWGSSAGQLSNSGTLQIKKVTSQMVSTTGLFKTTGTVTGAVVTFNGFTASDSHGRISYSFSSATLNGNVLTFTMYGSGILDGYSYRSTSYMQCVKQ